LSTVLAGRGGDNPEHLAYYVRALLSHEDDAGAAAWLRRLEAREKNPLSPRTVELRARVLARQKKSGEAADLLKRYAQEVFAAQKNPADLRKVGMLMAELKLTADAEEMLRRYVVAAREKQPAAVMTLAEFLARNDRVPEALAICAEALDAKVTPELVGRYTVLAVRYGGGNPEHFARAEEIFRRANAAAPQSIDLQVSFADLRDAQKQYDEAKRLYRALLHRGSRQSLDLVLNNLAWLLAVQEGNKDEAKGFIERAIHDYGPDGNLLDTRGVILLLAGDTEGAIADLSEAVAQEPVSARYFHLAQAYHKAGKLPEAQRAMRKARDLGFSEKDLHALELKDYAPMLALIGGTTS